MKTLNQLSRRTLLMLASLCAAGSAVSTAEGGARSAPKTLASAACAAVHAADKACDDDKSL